MRQAEEEKEKIYDELAEMTDQINKTRRMEREMVNGPLSPLVIAAQLSSPQSSLSSSSSSPSSL